MTYKAMLKHEACTDSPVSSLLTNALNEKPFSKTTHEIFLSSNHHLGLCALFFPPFLQLPFGLVMDCPYMIISKEKTFLVACEI